MVPGWLFGNHIPQGLELSHEQRADVRKLVREMGPNQRRFTPTSKRMLVYLMPRLLVLSLVSYAWILWLVRARPAGATFAILNTIGIIAFQVCLWVSIARSLYLASRPLVLRALNRLEIPVCEACGYILQHLPAHTANCPECGYDRTQTLNVDP
ncbi:MAG: hypothetical protein ACR2GY_04865 [Phycisphaerales bacterium]